MFKLITTKNSKLLKSDEFSGHETISYGLSLTAGYIKLNEDKDLTKDNLFLTCQNFGHCLRFCNSKTGFYQKTKNVIRSRYQRTKLLAEDPDRFFSLLRRDLIIHLAIAKAENKKAVFRLNISSDLVIDQRIKDLMSEFKDIQFYDYSKGWDNVELGSQIPNYHVSRSIRMSDLNDPIESFMYENRVIILPIVGKLPKLGYMKHRSGVAIRLIDGDLTDHRFNDKKYSSEPTLTILSFKGKQDDLIQEVERKNPYILTKNHFSINDLDLEVRYNA